MLMPDTRDSKLEASGTKAVTGASCSGLTEQGIAITPDWQSLRIGRSDNLPHWFCDRAIYHVSFRLADAVPRQQQDAWRAERTDMVRTAEALGRELSEHERNRLQRLYSDRIESFLDTGHGACHLREARIGNIVASALRHFDGERYRLHAWCVMPNHVHVIVETITAKHNLSGIVHSWKSFTALQANRMLGRTGPFWMTESYDHIIRSEDEYHRQVEYVRNNPDKAGLKNCPRERLSATKLEASDTKAVTGASCSGLAPKLEASATGES